MTEIAAPSATKTAQRQPKTPLEKARTTASKALDTTLDSAHRAANRTAKVIDANPLPILVGGLAVGALAGALIPRSRRESDLLAPVGRKLKVGTTEAINGAKQTGLAELGALGLTRSGLSDQAGKLVGGLLTALATAGTAAITASKEATSKPANAAK